MITLTKVSKVFNRHKTNQINAINNTSLELPDSGIVTLLGPSGCGKTTLLNAVGGLDKVTKGSIIVDGDCITRGLSGRIDNIRNAKIGYIFQNFNLIDNKTVFENVAVVLRMVGIKDKKVIEERVKYCLEAVGIYQFRHKNADALSGGQRQRVAIARAIAKNPRIIIADEPTGNLDSANTIEVMNIIKTISRDRLVLLVTHERKIAEFYSERIIEIKDGKVIDDRLNDGGNSLDYQLENKIYLRDMAVSESFASDDVKLNLYSDEDKEADIKIVIRGGNIYIDTGGAYNIVDETANIELIDDHYHAMDSSIYEEHGFVYDKYMPENFKARYRSIYTPWNMIGRGFHTVMNFKFLKKLLLLGFMFAAMFSFYAVSNAAGIVNIKDSDFMTTNKNYVTVSNPSHDMELIDKLSKRDDVVYTLPSNSLVVLNIPVGELLQTRSAVAALTGSVTHADQMDEADICYGRSPESDHEIVIDKMILDKYIKNDSSKSAGIYDPEQFLDKKAKIKGLKDYTIVGISDTGSPSFFIPNKQCMYVLTHAEGGNNDTMAMMDGYIEEGEIEEGTVEDIKLAPKAVELKKGEMPKDDYDVLVSNSHSEDEDYKIGKAIPTKVNGEKLVVCGYYTTDDDHDTMYVTARTIKLGYVSNKKVVSVYTNDPEGLAANLLDEGISAKVNYERDRSKYIKTMKESIKSSLILAALVLLVSLIEMFLMLRSSFLSRIKEVGTLRAIGLKKRDVYRMFSGEIIVITLLTSIPGIAAMYAILKSISGVSMYVGAAYKLSPALAAVTFGLMLFFNLVIGLLPVWKTMRKTPAAILARNDI